MKSTGTIIAIDEREYLGWCGRTDGVTVTAEQLSSPEAATRLVPARRSVGSVAVIPLAGYLTPKPTLFSILFGGTSVEAFAREVVAALNDPTIGAVVLDVDSPGGEVYGVSEAAAAIRAARGGKPLIAVVNHMAASAAYWLASQADEIVSTPSGMSGSIGAFVAYLDQSAAMEKAGVKVEVIKHGRRKAEGVASGPLSQEAIDGLQATVDYFGQLFEADVAKGRTNGARRVGVEAVRKDYGEGALMTADKAMASGLVDRIGTLADVVQRVANGYKPGAAAPAAEEPAPAVAAVDETAETPARGFDAREIAARARLAGIAIPGPRE